MKRDMELIRRLLFLIEEQNDDQKELKLPEDIDRQTMVYHLKLLEQAGYVKNNIDYADDEPYWINSSLTWEGYEFLDSIKNESVWGKIKETLSSELNDMPLTLIKTVGLEATKQWAFKKLGLK